MHAWEALAQIVSPTHSLLVLGGGAREVLCVELKSNLVEAWTGSLSTPPDDSSELLVRGLGGRV